MHKWGMGLSASTGGTQFYSGDELGTAQGLFVHAPGQSEPSTATGTLAPILATGNPSITWSCSDYNASGATLSFGDSAVSRRPVHLHRRVLPRESTSATGRHRGLAVARPRFSREEGGG